MSDPTRATEGLRPGAEVRPDPAVPVTPPGGPSFLAARATAGVDSGAAAAPPRDASAIVESLLFAGTASEVMFDLEGGGPAPEADEDVAGLLDGLAETARTRETDPARSTQPSPPTAPRWTRSGVVSLITVGGLLAGCAVGAFALGPAGLLMTVAVETMAFVGGMLVSQAGQQQLEAANRKLQYAAMHDPLTGLKNRGAIMEILEDTVAQWGGRRRNLAVVLADVDHFKQVNDTWGHPVGDEVLQEVARRVASSLRTEDAVGRYGGEEILVILPGLGTQEAVRAAERLRLELSGRPVTTAAGSLTVTASFGVAASAELASPTSGDLIKMADLALYRAKSGGRNRVEAATALDPLR